MLANSLVIARQLSPNHSSPDRQSIGGFSGVICCLAGRRARYDNTIGPLSFPYGTLSDGELQHEPK